MPLLKLGPLMRYYVDNQPELTVQGQTVLQAINDAVGRYPALGFHVFDSAGKLRRHLVVLVNDENIRELQGEQTKVKANDRLLLLASSAGG
jgi:molybdopterin converting factor small subunit